jgi:hypothetical protein
MRCRWMRPECCSAYSNFDIILRHNGVFWVADWLVFCARSFRLTRWAVDKDIYLFSITVIRVCSKSNPDEGWASLSNRCVFCRSYSVDWLCVTDNQKWFYIGNLTWKRHTNYQLTAFVAQTTKWSGSQAFCGAVGKSFRDPRIACPFGKVAVCHRFFLPITFKSIKLHDR